MGVYSIILPVRNGGGYFKTCVNSVLNQTYPHFNLHILDNCSTDGTSEWIQSINDSRIIYLPADKPLAIEENWARILQIPKNKFMTMIGHDDVLLPDYLSVIDTLIEKHPDASLYQTHFRYINGNSAFIRNCLKMEENITPGFFLEKILNLVIDINGTGFMVRSSDYNAVGVFLHIPIYFLQILPYGLKLQKKNIWLFQFTIVFLIGYTVVSQQARQMKNSIVLLKNM